MLGSPITNGNQSVSRVARRPEPPRPTHDYQNAPSKSPSVPGARLKAPFSSGALGEGKFPGMPIVPFDMLPDSSRLWVFASDRPLVGAVADTVLASVDQFLSEWRAHGVPLRCGRGLARRSISCRSGGRDGGKCLGLLDRRTVSNAATARANGGFEVGGRWAAILSRGLRDRVHIAR